MAEPILDPSSPLADYLRHSPQPSSPSCSSPAHPRVFQKVFLFILRPLRHTLSLVFSRSSTLILFASQSLLSIPPHPHRPRHLRTPGPSQLSERLKYLLCSSLLLTPGLHPSSSEHALPSPAHHHLQPTSQANSDQRSRSSPTLTSFLISPLDSSSVLVPILAIAGILFTYPIHHFSYPATIGLLSLLSTLPLATTLRARDSHARNLAKYLPPALSLLLFPPPDSFSSKLLSVADVQSNLIPLAARLVSDSQSLDSQIIRASRFLSPPSSNMQSGLSHDFTIPRAPRLPSGSAIALRKLVHSVLDQARYLYEQASRELELLILSHPSPVSSPSSSPLSSKDEGSSDESDYKITKARGLGALMEMHDCSREENQLRGYHDIQSSAQRTTSTLTKRQTWRASFHAKLSSPMSAVGDQYPLHSTPSRAPSLLHHHAALSGEGSSPIGRWSGVNQLTQDGQATQLRSKRMSWQPVCGTASPDLRSLSSPGQVSASSNFRDQQRRSSKLLKRQSFRLTSLSHSEEDPSSLYASALGLSPVASQPNRPSPLRPFANRSNRQTSWYGSPLGLNSELRNREGDAHQSDSLRVVINKRASKLLNSHRSTSVSPDCPDQLHQVIRAQACNDPRNAEEGETSVLERTSSMSSSSTSPIDGSFESIFRNRLSLHSMTTNSSVISHPLIKTDNKTIEGAEEMEEDYEKMSCSRRRMMCCLMAIDFDELDDTEDISDAGAQIERTENQKAIWKEIYRTVEELNERINALRRELEVELDELTKSVEGLKKAEQKENGLQGGAGAGEIWIEEIKRTNLKMIEAIGKKIEESCCRMDGVVGEEDEGEEERRRKLEGKAMFKEIRGQIKRLERKFELDMRVVEQMIRSPTTPIKEEIVVEEMGEIELKGGADQAATIEEGEYVESEEEEEKKEEFPQGLEEVIFEGLASREVGKLSREERIRNKQAATQNTKQIKEKPSEMMMMVGLVGELKEVLEELKMQRNNK